MRNRKVRAWASAALAFSVAACSFDIDDPTAITESDLQGDDAMTGLLVGAARSYEVAYDRLVLFTALVSDETTASGSWPTWHQTDKEGIIDAYASEGDHINIPWRMWRELQRARGDAEEAILWMEDFFDSPGTELRLAMVNLYAGITYADFGETFCEAAYNGGAAVPPSESFGLARDRLNRALDIVAATSEDEVAGKTAASIAEMVHLVLARIAMEEGQYDEAIAHARAISGGFVWWAHYPSGQSNYTWGNWMERGESTVQGPFRETGDPRVPVLRTERVGPDNLTTLWLQQKYPDENMDWHIGKWQEARLIEAEALLYGPAADVDGAIALMNEVRSESPELGSLGPGASAAEARELLGRETMYELWLEARRMVYMRRWDEFAEGWATCLPISGEEERTNPNL